MKKGFIRNRHLFLVDLLMCFIAHICLITLVVAYKRMTTYLMGGFDIIVTCMLVYLLVLSIFGVYKMDWVFAGPKDYMVLLSACLTASSINIVLGLIMRNPFIFPKLNISTNIGIAILICGVRFFLRLIYKYMVSFKNSHSKRGLIIGAGRLAVTLLRDIETNKNLSYDIVGLIDDDPEKHNRIIYGSKVLGGREDIEKICREKDVEEIIFAIFTIPHDEKQEILDICSKTGCKVKILPSIAAAINGEFNQNTIREVEIEDLLERDPICLDNKLIEDDIFEKTVLVTGGGGSIGSELCRQLLRYNPHKLVILDIYENTTYELQLELEKAYPHQDLDVIIASVRDENRLESIFEKYRPDIVFHAAAHKHVPLMENNPCEAIKNNVFGTYNLVKCADKYAAQSFIMISTDKAVNPTNVMGASKRMCEMIVQSFARRSKTKFVAVRFGNVLGSHGSVIPLFKKQISQGGPVTVTHPEITRFFMTIPEAAQLVLQAAAYAKGGEIFVLDMGKPVKIYDLARKLISLSGYKPNEDIMIEFTGLRPGEKLYEELLMDEEGLTETSHNKIFIGKPTVYDEETLNENLNILRNAVNEDSKDIKLIMQQIVPTYKRKD